MGREQGAEGKGQRGEGFQMTSDRLSILRLCIRVLSLFSNDAQTL